MVESEKVERQEAKVGLYTRSFGERMTISKIAALHPDGDIFAQAVLEQVVIYRHRGSAAPSKDIPIPDAWRGGGLRAEIDEAALMRTFQKYPDLQPEPLSADPRHGEYILVHRDDLRRLLVDSGDWPLGPDIPLSRWWSEHRRPMAVPVPRNELAAGVSRSQMRNIKLREFFRVLEISLEGTDKNPFETLAELRSNGLKLTAAAKGYVGDDWAIHPGNISDALARVKRAYRAVAPGGTHDATVEAWATPVTVLDGTPNKHTTEIGNLWVSESNCADVCRAMRIEAYHWPITPQPESFEDLAEKRIDPETPSSHLQMPLRPPVLEDFKNDLSDDQGTTVESPIRKARKARSNNVTQRRRDLREFQDALYRAGEKNLRDWAMRKGEIPFAKPDFIQVFLHYYPQYNHRGGKPTFYELGELGMRFQRGSRSGKQSQIQDLIRDEMGRNESK